MRDLSIKGSILLAETEGLSGLVYTALALDIPQSVIKEVDTFLFNFIWKNRQHYIKNTILCNPIERLMVVLMYWTLVLLTVYLKTNGLRTETLLT